MSKSKKTIVKVQKRSAFNKSHKVLTTLECGTITPILTDELMANSDVNLKIDISAMLPPLASSTYMRSSIRVEGFFVPTRLLYGGWQKFLTQDTQKIINTAGVEVEKRVIVPAFVYDKDIALSADSQLLEHFDYREKVTGEDKVYCNILPFLAYHKIYDDFYRCPNITKPCFSLIQNANGGIERSRIDSITHSTFVEGEEAHAEFGEWTRFSNGHYLTATHQRNFDTDYFTGCMPTPQKGAAQSAEVMPVGEGKEGITIAAIRVANSLQKFAERNALAGPVYKDYLRANYGGNLSDGIAQRSICLGSAKFDIYSNGIYSTASDTQAGNQTNNPFATLTGGKVGEASCNGSNFLINHFHTNEPGYIMVMATLCPEAPAYGSGTPRLASRYSTKSVGDIMDMANPIFAGIGNQPVYKRELKNVQYLERDSIFGYTERFAEWKTMTDRVRGLFRKKSSAGGQLDESLNSWVLQRFFSPVTDVAISTNFLAIPKNFMDDVTLVQGDISRYGCMFDSYLNYHVVQPLPYYDVQPTLEAVDEEHQTNVVINKNGRRF